MLFLPLFLLFQCSWGFTNFANTYHLDRSGALLALRQKERSSSTDGSNPTATSIEQKINEKSKDQGDDKGGINLFNLAGLDGDISDSVVKPLQLLLFSQFLLFIGVGAVIPSIPLYGKEIGLSNSANGIVISAPAVALLLGAKFGGNFADIARKPAMMWGMALIAVSDLGTALAPNLGPLVLARLGLGAGRCISEAGERGMLADLANQIPSLRGRALAAQQATVALGIAIGAPLGGIVVQQYGARASFLCVTAAALAALTLYAFLPESITSTTDINSSGEETNATPPSEEGDWMKLLQMEEWRGLALCQVGSSFGFAAKIASIPILAAATLPGGAVGAGALVSAAGLSGLIGAPVGGWLTDRLGAKSTAVLSGIFSAFSLISIPVALTSLSTNADSYYVLSLFGGDAELGVREIAFSMLVILWSIGAAAQGPALTALAQKMSPSGAEATAMALPRAAGDGTYIVAPFLLGVAADSLGIQGVECAVAGSTTLLGMVALNVFTKDDR